MRIDEKLYFISLGLQIVAGILIIFNLLAFAITLLISIIVKGIAYQLADNKIIELEKLQEINSEEKVK